MTRKGAVTILVVEGLKVYMCIWYNNETIYSENGVKSVYVYLKYK